MADDGYNDSPMQAQLGLTSGTGTMSPFGFMTPPPLPYVRHPGEASQDVVARTQTQAAQTIQAAMMNRPGVLSTGGAAMGGFAQQYSANMAAMNGQMFNPFVAQTMASMGGASGFSPGMMPSPVSMTMPNMGNYRSSFQGPVSTFPPTPPMPLIPTPFTPTLPHPSFSTPMDFGYNQAHYRGIQQTSAFVSAPGIAARGATDVASSYVGAGLGALLGSKLGGARGAAFGSTAGALAGLIGGETMGFGAAAERMTDRFNPFRSIYSQAQQLQSGSTGYVVGGSDLESTGRGLNSNASRHLAMGLRQFSRTMPSSGDSFTNTDMIKMTQMAGENGMLNMSQNTDQIVNQMKTVAKSMKVFMQLAGEPDMRAAMKSMGQLYAMGISVPEMTGLAQQAKMYSKMAGTSFGGIMQSGLAGAEVFQYNGLTAGLGMQVGMGSMGMAQQAVAGGAYSPQLLAMQGGVQGIAQREMMSQAATLKMPMMAMAAANYSGGAFGMNSGTAQGMAGGQFNMGQLATMGANNMMQAVSKGGVGAMGLYKLQEPMLQDQMGRELGPMGLKNMGFQNVIQNMKMLGLSGAGGFATVATSLYGADTARDMVAQGSSPEFMSNMQRQLDVQRNDMRGQAKRKLEDSRGGFFERRLGITPLRKQAWAQRLTDAAYELGENVSSAFDFTAENAAEANGQQLDRVSTRLLASSPQERGQMARLNRGIVAEEMRLTSAAAAEGPYARGESALGYNARGEAYGTMWGRGRSGYLKEAYNQAHGGGTLRGIKDFFGASREEMQGFMDSAGKTGAVVSKALNIGEKDWSAASARLTAAGVSGEKREMFITALSQAARGGNALTDEHRQIAKGLGLDEKTAEDLLLVGGGSAEAMAGPEGSTTFSAPAASSGALGFMTAAVNRRRDLLTAVMGKGSSDEAKEKVLAILYKDNDPEAAALAALRFTADKEGAAEVLAGAKNPAKTNALAVKILKELSLPENKQLEPAIRGLAQSLKTNAKESKSSLATSSKGLQQKALANKAQVDQYQGLKKMGGAMAKVAETGDMDAAFRAIAKDEALANGDKLLYSQALKYVDSATTDAERSDMQTARLNKAASSVAASGTSQSGGVRGNEEALNRIADDLGMTGAQMSQIFKDGSPLDRSAVQLDYAANKLLDAATALNSR